jgi:hypothetical protein
MIPYYKTMIGKRDVLTKRLNIDRLDMPVDVIRAEEGLVVNHEYLNLVGYFTWEDFRLAYDSEKKIIEYADKNSKTAKEFEQVIEELVDQEKFDVENLSNHEVGIASLVFALSAFCCAPISGCRAHPNGSYSDAPSVGLYAPKRKAKTLLRIAQYSTVGIVNNDNMDAAGGIEIYAHTVTDLMQYAHNLFVSQNPSAKNKRLIK